MSKCPFCGQEHEPGPTWMGVPTRVCPNLPTGWMALGPDANNDLTIVQVGQEGVRSDGGA